MRAMPTRWSRLILALAGLCLLVAGAPGCKPPRGQPAAGGPRVVSLHDVTTEIAVALGAAGSLVGVAEPVQLPAETRAAVARLPRVEGAESILALRPTVVLGTAVVGRLSPELVGFLRGRGIEVFLGQPTTLEDVLGLVGEVGARVGAAPAAAALGHRLRQRLGEVAPVVARREPLRVLVYDCCDPPFTAGGSAVLTDVIRRAGGRNVFGDLAAEWTKVSWEEVIARRPQLIVIHDYQYEGQGGVAEKRRKLATMPSLARIPVTVMPLGFSLGGLRSFEGLLHLRRVISETRDPS
jgi:iron complex transport system substrate-binding protein